MEFMVTVFKVINFKAVSYKNDIIIKEFNVNSKETFAVFRKEKFNKMYFIPLTLLFSYISNFILVILEVLKLNGDKLIIQESLIVLCFFIQ